MNLGVMALEGQLSCSCLAVRERVTVRCVGGMDRGLAVLA